MWPLLNHIWYSTKWQIIDVVSQEEDIYTSGIQDPSLPSWKPSRDLNFLYPKFKDIVVQLLDTMHSSGVPLYVFEARRSFKRQQYLYEQGRSRKYDSRGNRLKIVTKAPPGRSYHNYGLAVDFVFDADSFKSGMQWTWNGDYSKLGEHVKDFPDLEWAGNWKRFPEYPHVQMTYGYSIDSLNTLYEKSGAGYKGIQAIWDTLDGKIYHDFSEDV